MRHIHRRVALLATIALSGCGGGKAPEPPPSSVAIATAQSATVSDRLTGLGHVEAMNTVTVHAQMAGQLLSLGFAEGQPVAKGQIIARIDPRPLLATLAQDQAALARDMAALANARQTLARNAPLVGAGVASVQDMARYQTGAAQAAATVAGDRASIERDRLMLAYATIRAPIAGVAGIRMVDPGNVVTPTDPNGIVTISQIEPAYIVFSLPQAALASVQQAMANGQQVMVEAQAPGGQTLDRGCLAVIDNRIDPATGMVLLKARFANATHQLWPGAQVNARIELAAQPNTVTIPASALQSGPAGAYVWVVGADQRVRQRQIATGIRNGDSVAIPRGLAAGEKVVSDGQFGLTTGSRVIVASSTSAPQRQDDPAHLGLVP